jgi:pilus assembly protein CpaE
MSDETSITMHSEFMAFVTDEESLALMRAWVQKQGWPLASAQVGGVDKFTSLLGQAQPPRVVLVDLDGRDDQLAAAAEVVAAVGNKTQVIGIGSINDVRIYRQFILNGLTDYIVKPLSEEALSEALTSAQKPKSANGADLGPREAKIVFVIGTRGGVGTSTFCTNLSWILSQEQKFNTALVDLDLQYGTAALALDIEPGRGARDIMSSPSRVDSLMIASSMVVATNRLSVLSAEEHLEEPTPIDPSALNAIIKEVRGNFDFVIIDMPRNLVTSQRRLLGMAHAIVLVCDQSLFGIRDCLRLKLLVKSATERAQMLIVTARHGKDRPPQVDQATFERGIQDKISFHIPEDFKVINEAANTGKPAAQAAPQSASIQIVRAIAEQISGSTKVADGKDAKPAKSAGLGGMFGSKKK